MKKIVLFSTLRNKGVHRYKSTNTTEGGSTASISNVDDYYEELAWYVDKGQEELITVTDLVDEIANFHVYHYFEDQD